MNSPNSCSPITLATTVASKNASSLLSPSSTYCRIDPTGVADALLDFAKARRRGIVIPDEGSVDCGLGVALRGWGRGDPGGTKGGIVVAREDRGVFSRELVGAPSGRRWYVGVLSTTKNMVSAFLTSSAKGGQGTHIMW